MNTFVERCLARRAAYGPLALAGVLLAGCGGNEDLAADPAATAQSTPVRVAVGQGRSSEPVDPAARTRRGLYLSRSLAERLDRERRGDVVWVDAGCCASAARNGDDLDLAVLIAFAVQAAKDAGPEVPFLVYGSDLRQAARLADRLVASGAPNTVLVTP